MSSGEENTRKRLADQAVEILKQKLIELGGLHDFSVHWDDCDMDCRKFWIHFRPDSMEFFIPKNRNTLVTAQLIRAAMRGCKKLEDSSDYQFSWDKIEVPTAVYQMIDGRKYFKEYDVHRWVYTLTFYGGPA